MFVNIASCTNVIFLSCYMLLFHCCDKTWWRRQLIKGISYFDLWSRKVSAHHWWGSLTGSSRPGIRSWELRVHIFKRQREERTRISVRELVPKTTPSNILSSSRLCHLKTSLNNATNQEPIFQITKTTGDVSHPNHHACWIILCYFACLIIWLDWHTIR